MKRHATIRNEISIYIFDGGGHEKSSYYLCKRWKININIKIIVTKMLY